MNRKAQGSGAELDIPMDGRKIDRLPHSVAPATAAIIVVLVLCSTLSALGHSPFRLEGAYVYSNRVELSGMADITRWLAVRVSLLSAYWSVDSDDRYFGLESDAGILAFNAAYLMVSPWHRRLRIQPYAFAGLGARYWQGTGVTQGETDEMLIFRASYGVGVEPLLFFVPHAPALFLELGQVVTGSNMVFQGVPHDPYPPLWWLENLRTGTRIAVGIRI